MNHITARIAFTTGAVVIAAVLIRWCASGSAAADGQAAGAAPAFDAARAWSHLEALVGIGPRPAGSAQIHQARAYITRELRALGLTVQEQPFTADTPVGRVAMTNLIVRLPGRRSERIVIGGHYDTKLFAGQLFVGANDGGSSAAMLIELARVLAGRPHEHTLELVWFDGEEAFGEWISGGRDHTYGSRFYVQAAREAGALDAIRALVLVDMVADRDLRIRRDELSTPWLTDIVWAAARRVGHGAVFVDESLAVEDDHLPFLEAGIPAVDIIDLDYSAWHTPADTLEQISASSLKIVGEVVLAALPDLDRTLLTR